MSIKSNELEFLTRINVEIENATFDLKFFENRKALMEPWRKSVFYWAHILDFLALKLEFISNNYELLINEYEGSGICLLEAHLFDSLFWCNGLVSATSEAFNQHLHAKTEIRKGTAHDPISDLPLCQLVSENNLLSNKLFCLIFLGYSKLLGASFAFLELKLISSHRSNRLTHNIADMAAMALQSILLARAESMLAALTQTEIERLRRRTKYADKEWRANISKTLLDNLREHVPEIEEIVKKVVIVHPGRVLDGMVINWGVEYAALFNIEDPKHQRLNNVLNSWENFLFSDSRLEYSDDEKIEYTENVSTPESAKASEWPQTLIHCELILDTFLRARPEERVVFKRLEHDVLSMIFQSNKLICLFFPGLGYSVFDDRFTGDKAQHVKGYWEPKKWFHHWIKTGVLASNGNKYCTGRNQQHCEVFYQAKATIKNAPCENRPSIAPDIIVPTAASYIVYEIANELGLDMDSSLMVALTNFVTTTLTLSVRRTK